MGGSTSGGSSGGVSRQPATIKPKAGTKPGEQGRYTIPSGPAGARLATTTMDPDKLTAKRQERAASIAERTQKPDQPVGSLTAEREYEREASIAELTGRLDRTLPGIAGGLGRVSLERQIAALKKGAAPVKIETPSGDFLTVGTITEKGDYTGRAEYAEIAKETAKGGASLPFVETTLAAAEERAAGLRAEEEPSTIITPEVTPEVTPEADSAMLGESGATRRRRTKRAGAAGTLLEGGGVLYE